MNPQAPKVLLVEDEDSIRDLYTRQISRAGFTVKAVADGQQGITALGTEVFDILLLDIMLPGINGLQVLREFKAKYPNSTMKVILLTNLGQEAVIKEGFSMGANAYLIKSSYTPDQIVQEIKNALANQPITTPQNPSTT